VIPRLFSSQDMTICLEAHGIKRVLFKLLHASENEVTIDICNSHFSVLQLAEVEVTL